MLTIYRRHRKGCPHGREGRKYRRCRCPIWVDGFVGGQEIRKSLDTADWQKAQDTVREWEATASEPSTTQEPISIEQAGERLLSDGKSRNLSESTLYKYRLLFREIGDFTQRRGLRYLKELDLTTLDDFRTEWKDGPRSSLKKLERLRAWLAFCEQRKWITENPARNLRLPKVKDRPTLPFTSEEMVTIFATLDGKYESRSAKCSAA